MQLGWCGWTDVVGLMWLGWCSWADVVGLVCLGWVGVVGLVWLGWCSWAGVIVLVRLYISHINTTYIPVHAYHTYTRAYTLATYVYL